VDPSGNWETSRQLDPYRPHFHGTHVSKFGRPHLESTLDPTKIDLWIRHHVRQHLVIDCRVPDASEGDKVKAVIVLQVQQLDVLIITDVLGAVLSPLLKFILNSPIVAKITAYPEAVQQTLVAILADLDDWGTHWFDVSEFIPFIMGTSLSILLDIIGRRAPVCLTSQSMKYGPLPWETGPNCRRRRWCTARSRCTSKQAPAAGPSRTCSHSSSHDQANV